jgi:hypothetical protein
MSTSSRLVLHCDECGAYDEFVDEYAAEEDGWLLRQSYKQLASAELCPECAD